MSGSGGAMPCVFCEIIEGRGPAHVVLDDEVCMAFLDVRPVFDGHVLVVPRAHVVTLRDLPAEMVGPFFERVQAVSAAVEDGLGADGSFVAANNRVSQSVAHLHLHVVPRHRGDGLRGFFWPRHRYPDDDIATDIASRIGAALRGQ